MLIWLEILLCHAAKSLPLPRWVWALDPSPVPCAPRARLNCTCQHPRIIGKSRLHDPLNKLWEETSKNYEKLPPFKDKVPGSTVVTWKVLWIGRDHFFGGEELWSTGKDGPKRHRRCNPPAFPWLWEKPNASPSSFSKSTWASGFWSHLNAHPNHRS